MGTKIEQAIDTLASSTNSNNSFTLQYRVDDWNYLLQARKLNKFQKSDSDSMDRSMLEKHNIESIKKTMQIHEEIFKHQVKELHRLYSVQKRLMGELRKESKQNNTRIWSSSLEMNHSQFINKRNNNINHATTTTQTNSVSAIDEHAAGPSNIKMSIDNDNEDSEVELTLSIGVSSSGSSSSSKNKKKSKGYQGEDYSSCPNTPMSSSSATFDQEKKMPHWLFGLSINRS